MGLASALAISKGDRPLKLRHLPTNGGGPAITSILGNNAQSRRNRVGDAAHVKAGKLRALASFAPRASKFAPDVPTLKELATTSNIICVGIFAPKQRRRRS